MGRGDQRLPEPEPAARMPEAELERLARGALRAGFGISDTGPLVARSKTPEHGDFQLNAAMKLAKELDLPPREIAERLAAELEKSDLVAGVEVAGPGFVNVRLTEDYLAAAVVSLAEDERLGIAAADPPQRVVIDYSAPNIAKEMHVGHLRSTVIGDALSRILEAEGHTVVRQNHLGDWGTQFGMLLVELEDSGEHLRDFAQLSSLYQRAKQRFDGEAGFATRARARVVDLQQGEQTALARWQDLVDVSVDHISAIYASLDVTLSREDIRGESAYNAELEEVVDTLSSQGVLEEDQGATVFHLDGHDAPLLVRKRDGGYLYGATDLAALRHRSRQLAGERMVYVTDSRQSDHFAAVFAAAKQAGWLDDVSAEHVSFGTVLGEDGKPFKTRSGKTVPLADLIGEATRRARAVAERKNPDLDPTELDRRAAIVGVGALKYADLVNGRVRDYVFSFDRMLALDGNTAPYLLYAVARARSILHRADEAEITPSTAEIRVRDTAERELALKLCDFGPTVHRAAGRLEPHHLCGYLYELADSFSGFYEHCPVIAAADPETQASRRALVELTARVLTRGLNLLGIRTLEQM